MTTTGHLTKLVMLAKEKSPETRRALLHDITNLFIADPAFREGQVGVHADEILTKVACDLTESVRAELAERFADAEVAPSELIRRLAQDAIDVARPLLERCGHLDEATLIKVAQERGQEHLRLIAKRDDVSERVADVVAARGDDDTLVNLVSNDKAKLSRTALETIVDRAETNPALHAPVVNRKELPADLLNEMYFIVGETLKATIAERQAALDPAEIEAAMAAARERLTRNSKARPAGYDDAVKFISMKKLRKQLDAPLLGELLERGETLRATVAFAELSGLEFNTARRILDNPAVDPLAIACKSADVDREVFVTIAVLRKTKGAKTKFDADVLRQVYDVLPKDAAERVMRFWKVREAAEKAA